MVVDGGHWREGQHPGGGEIAAAAELTGWDGLLTGGLWNGADHFLGVEVMAEGLPSATAWYRFRWTADVGYLVGVEFEAATALEVSRE